VVEQEAPVLLTLEGENRGDQVCVDARVGGAVSFADNHQSPDPPLVFIDLDQIFLVVLEFGHELEDSLHVAHGNVLLQLDGAVDLRGLQLLLAELPERRLQLLHVLVHDQVEQPVGDELGVVALDPLLVETHQLRAAPAELNDVRVEEADLDVVLEHSHCEPVSYVLNLQVLTN